MKISIIIPVFNEEKTIKNLLKKVDNVKIDGIKKEIVIVDDFSTDKTRSILKKIKSKNKIIIFQDKNYGKGRAIRDGIKKATGEIIIIQDADNEYNPKDYKKLIKPILDKKTSVVYGSRFMKKNPKIEINSFYIGNKILSAITSILFMKKITDMETCYKVFEKNVIQNLELKSDRFEIEPEITAKLLKKKTKIIEIPIDYNPRTKSDGKKIKWFDGVNAILTLLKYRIVK